MRSSMYEELRAAEQDRKTVRIAWALGVALVVGLALCWYFGIEINDLPTTLG